VCSPKMKRPLSRRPLTSRSVHEMHDGVAAAKHKDRYSEPEHNNGHCRLLCTFHFVFNAEVVGLVQQSRLTWNDFPRPRFKGTLGTVGFLIE
jgi:hypothetical protein